MKPQNQRKSLNPRSTRRNPNNNALNAQRIAGKIQWSEKLSIEATGQLAKHIENNLHFGRHALDGTLYANDENCKAYTLDPKTAATSAKKARSVIKRSKPSMKKTAHEKPRHPLRALPNGYSTDLSTLCTRSPVKLTTEEERKAYMAILKEVKEVIDTANESAPPVAATELFPSLFSFPYEGVTPDFSLASAQKAPTLTGTELTDEELSLIDNVINGPTYSSF